MSAYVLDRYVQEYTLQASDITLSTSTTNVDFIAISAISGMITSSFPAVANHMVEGFTTYSGSTNDFDTTDLIGYSIHSAWWGGDTYLIVAKGTYADLAAAQADLAGTKIWYQLATPLLANEVIDVDGTLIQESVTTVEQLQNIPTSVTIEYSMDVEQTTKTLVERDKLQQLEIDSLEVDVATRLLRLGGITASRPATPSLYQMYFDTTLNVPIWWNGTNWVNHAGTTV